MEPGYKAMRPTISLTSQNLLAMLYRNSSNGQIYRTYSLDRGNTWNNHQRIISGSPAFNPRSRYNFRGGFAVVWMDDDDIWFVEILDVVTLTDHVISIRVQRSKSSSSKGATVEILNPNQLYDPEVPNTKWSGVFYPGAPIVIRLGYGGEVVTRFKGNMDQVSIDDEQPVITITCRGEFRQLLDQSIKEKRTFNGERRTDTIGDMAAEAGMNMSFVQIQDDPRIWSGEKDRETTYEQVTQEQIDALGYEIIEPDEGGLIARAPYFTTTPVWFYEEEINMYSREREFTDEDVFTSVMVYREDKFNSDGVLELAGFTREVTVATDFQTPDRKCFFYKADEFMSSSQGLALAQELARRIGLQGKAIQIAGPFNPGLELGDPIQIRRKSISQAGIYLIEELDDDFKRNDGRSRGEIGTPSGGKFENEAKTGGVEGGGGGLGMVIQAVRIANA